MVYTSSISYTLLFVIVSTQYHDTTVTTFERKNIYNDGVVDCDRVCFVQVQNEQNLISSRTQRYSLAIDSLETY